MTGLPNLLYASECPVSDRIKVRIPTVGEILDDEENYYSTLSLLTATPYTYMVELADMGIDYTTITEYDLFLMLAGLMRERDMSLFFGDLDFGGMELGFHIETGKPVLWNEDEGIVIDKVVYTKIAGVLRHIHGLKPENKKPGNKDAMEYMLRRAREKASRRKKRKEESQLSQLIVAMVNTEQFKYNYEGTRELSIFQFNESVRQITKKVDYDNIMHGVYAGTVDPKELSQEKLNWLGK